MKKPLGILSILAGAFGLVAGGLFLASGVLALLDSKHDCHCLKEPAK